MGLSTSCVSGKRHEQIGLEVRLPHEGEDIHLVTWNVHKGKSSTQFRADLRALFDGFEASAEVILCVQETTDALFDAYRLFYVSKGLGGQFAPSWRWFFSSTMNGVMTLASLPESGGPTYLLAPWRELLFTSRKASLVTRYALANGEQLAVSNCHGLNFVPEFALNAQLARLTDTLLPHQGPMVLCGDFNTWSADRVHLVQQAAAKLGMVEVLSYHTAGGTPPWWLIVLTPMTGWLTGLDTSLPLDRVYVRGLKVVSAVRRDDLQSSDHRPIVVTLRASETSTNAMRSHLSISHGDEATGTADTPSASAEGH